MLINLGPIISRLLLPKCKKKKKKKKVGIQGGGWGNGSINSFLLQASFIHITKENIVRNANNSSLFYYDS